MSYKIIPYEQRYAASWLSCWLLTAGASHAWWYICQSKPAYDGPSVELVAVDDDDEVVGFLDIEVESSPGNLCLRSEPGQAFAWELGVARDLWGRGVGCALLREAERLLAGCHQVRYVEWWSMDFRSQAWYERRGMELINSHWRFAVEPDEEITAAVKPRGARPVNALLTCSESEWPLVQESFKVITRPPLEPHLCRGYAHRF